MRNPYKVKPIIAFVMVLLLTAFPLIDGFGGKAYADSRKVIVTVVGTGARGASGDGGPATSAQLNSPQNVVFDSAGNMYISDQNENRVRKVDALTGEISTLAGTGTSGDSGDGGQAASAQLSSPYALAFHDGELYIGGFGTVRKVDLPSGTISTVAGNGSCNDGADIGDGGPAISANLCWIRGLAFDSHGNMYISSTNDARVRKVNALTGIISTVAGTGEQGYSAVETSAALSPLTAVAGLAVDDEDNLYIVEEYSSSTNGFIRKVDPSGNISIVAGGGNLETGPATSVNLNGPIGLTFHNGELFISTYTTILKLDLAAGTISKVAGSGNTGYSGDGGPASAANLFSPNGVAFDGDGYLHIADTENHVVRRIGESNDAGLSSLTLSSGSLSPGFSSGTTDYTAVIPSSESSITVTPTVRDSYATVEVNGTAVTSGMESGAIDLSVGDTVAIVVTAEDGTKKTYKVTRTSLSNANLSSLTLSSGVLSPTFAPGTTGYAASVANGVSSIAVTPTVSDSNATVKVNGTTVTSGAASGAITLSVGDNPISVVVTAQDGTTTSTYAVMVTRAPSGNANLSSLTLSSGSLSPAFAAGTTGYTASVANGVSSITVTPTVSDSNATVKVNGTTVTSGAASGAITLSVGDNPISVVVTAQDGTTTSTYAVMVTRAPSGNANLSSLTLSSGSLSPAFAAGTTSYAASVGNGVSSITVTPTVSDSNATVKVNGTTVTSGAASGAITLSVGDNPISVVVTAQDGTTTKTYAATVTRAPSGNASLSSLTLSSGVLSPTFAPGTTSYAASVANGVSGITVTPTVSDSNATVKVNGTTVTSGAASGAINLSVGDNPISVVVTAEDGTTTSTYAVTVTRAATIAGGDSVSRSANASLSGLTLSSGSLSPAFAAGTTGYAASVANGVSSITVTPTLSDRTATVKVNGATVTSGSASGAIGLSVGDNLITVAVTAQDGTTTRTYIVTVKRAGDSASPPASPGPLLNDAITNVKKVKEAALAALDRTAPEPFPDVPTNSWSSRAIEVALQLGIVQGRPDGSFHGGESITRAEFVAMVAKALYLDTTSERDVTFSDTQGHWAAPAIETLKAAGVIEGVGAGSFKPDQPITRAEISAILARMMVFDQTTGNAYFSDTSDSWARPYIAQMADADIVRGAGDGKFYPNAYTTREQAVAMIIRMLTVCRNVDLQLIDLSK